MSACHPRLTLLLWPVRLLGFGLHSLHHRPLGSLSRRRGTLVGHPLFSLLLQGEGVLAATATAAAVGSASVSVKQPGLDHPSCVQYRSCFLLSGREIPESFDSTRRWAPTHY